MTNRCLERKNWKRIEAIDYSIFLSENTFKLYLINAVKISTNVCFLTINRDALQRRSCRTECHHGDEPYAEVSNIHLLARAQVFGRKSREESRMQPRQRLGLLR